MTERSIRLVFEGAFACFTRPEFAAERMSYDLPPPTAARGMVEAVLWKPEISYRINSVAVLPHSSGRRARFMRLTTNEVKSFAPCDVGARRIQRRNYVLRDVAYMVEVDILPGSRPMMKAGHNIETYRAMLTRRASKGQGVETPCLGLRDFPASVRLAAQDDVPIPEDRPLGPMTYIVWRRDESTGEPVRSQATVNALMEQGVVDMREWPQ